MRLSKLPAAYLLHLVFLAWGIRSYVSILSPLCYNFTRNDKTNKKPDAYLRKNNIGLLTGSFTTAFFLNYNESSGFSQRPNNSRFINGQLSNKQKPYNHQKWAFCLSSHLFGCGNSRAAHRRYLENKKTERLAPHGLVFTTIYSISAKSIFNHDFTNKTKTPSMGRGKVCLNSAFAQAFLRYEQIITA